jgi:tetratricopeptide (TPR) repeat protein
VAYARLAELKLKAGETETAIEMLESLNRIFPNHKSHLRKLALAYSATNQSEKAIEIWRKLAFGQEPGSDRWFEAKYQLVSGLLNSGNRESARQVYEQTILLGNEMPETWQAKFDALHERLLTE